MKKKDFLHLRVTGKYQSHGIYGDSTDRSGLNYVDIIIDKKEAIRIANLITECLLNDILVEAGFIIKD